MVGTTERFTETLLIVSREVGIANAMYRKLNVGWWHKERESLLNNPAERAAIRNLSAFDSSVPCLVRWS